MKTRILSVLLVISLLLNVAGLVFFICFLNLKGHYKTISRERNQFADSLTHVRLAGIVDDSAPDRLQKRIFVSHFDGQTDSFGLLVPNLEAMTKDLTLAVYLHGMGSNYLEPFFYPQGNPVAEAVVRKYPQMVFLSCSYGRDASWGNDAAISDITQNIRDVMQEFPVSHIVLFGTSMGGCVALTYATQAPDDIKGKILGVVSVESSGDMSALYNESHNHAIQPAMDAAFGGTPEQKPEVYHHRSFLYNLDGLPAQARVAVVSARDDDVVPPDLQKKIVAELESRHLPVQLVEVAGGHGAPPSDIYMKALDFVLQKGS